MGRLVLDLDPCPAPRQSKRDGWRPSAPVRRYRAFRDAVNVMAGKRRKEVPWEGLTVTFRVPMPKSWPKYRREEMDGQPHQQKPDLDNLLKALADALWPDDDTHLWDVRARKVWAREGRIEIEWEAPQREEMAP